MESTASSKRTEKIVHSSSKMAREVDTDIRSSNKRGSILAFLLFIGMILSYYDRLAINIAMVPIEKELLLNPSQTGLLLSVFFISMSIMQPLGGWLSDKFGARTLIIISMLSWSVFTVMTGLAWSFVSLLIIRFLFGLGEGPYHPAGLVVIRENFPEGKRGRINAFFLSAQPLGGVVASLVATVMVVKLGWRWTFMSAGIFGILLALAFWLVLQPRETPKRNVSGNKLVKVPLRLVIKAENIWKIMSFKFLASVVNWGLMSWMPLYLVKEKGINLLATGGLIAIPYITGFLMYNLSGWILDKYMIGREKYLAAMGALVAAIFLYCMSQTTSIILLITFLTLTTIGISFIGTTLFTIIIKYAPKEVTGSVTGLVTLTTQVAGAVSPIVIGLIISLFNGSFDAAFWFLSISALCGMIIGLTINNNRGAVKS